MPSTQNRWLLILLLAVFFGIFGVHRFAVGKIGTGFLYLFTYGLLGIGWLVDIVLIATGKFKDKGGHPISRIPEESKPGSAFDSGTTLNGHASDRPALSSSPPVKKSRVPALSGSPRYVSRFDSWVAVDVEWTDSANKSSICEIGLARFEDGRLTESWRSYVRPPGKFSVGFMELRTHGIKAHLLEDAPSLASIWPTIEEFTEDRGWVLHNATNDVNRILHSLTAGGLSTPRDFDYIDSMGLARKFSWVQSSSSLDALAEYFDLEREFASYEGREKFSTPHGAVEDAQLTGLVLQRMVELTGYSNLSAFIKVLEVDPGRVRGGQLLNGFSARGGFSYSDPSELPPQDEVLKKVARATQQAAKAEERKKAAENRRAEFLRNPEWSDRKVVRGDKVCFTQLMPWGEGSQNHEAEVHKVANRLGIELRYSLRSDLDLLVVNDPWVFESAKLRDALSRRNPIPVTTYSVFQQNNPEFPVWKYAKSPEYRELVKSGLWPGGQG